MTKLLITEITRMGPAFCVIGLQHDQQKFLSIRPVSSTANSWLHFPYQRGEILECSLTSFVGTPPHVEDRTLTRSFQRCSAVAEHEVSGYLRKAECSDSLSGLFECRIYENKRGTGAHALPVEARRSICGCHTQNLRLELYANELRATLVLSSGELLRDLPVVDRDWLDFMDAAFAESRGANRAARFERFLNSRFHYKIMSCPHHFVRIGLTRPYRDVCWLMLDTLFPLPQMGWLEEF
jgi:hypothetical protein